MKPLTSQPLVQWTYSRDEWRSFLRWKQRRKGVIPYILHRLSLKKHKTPTITVTHGSVCTGKLHEHFHDRENHLKRIHIRDTGAINVIEITYERNSDLNDICVPVPKGRLREAIALQEEIQLTFNR